ncbi:DinB family protein [Fictibacillus nanhaiensis]|uniref:DinB family protein n=1 Tax=Fictibacillus nanhaiensis TaxID=742169 RepID=UPI001C95D709|nr:DinB family protein [Fictibacillus nanhaiensis]MBY6036813.1 DinB family protein [Fictibacillus nanhaiensis]
MKDAIQLYQYNIWANHRVFEQLNQLSDDIYKKEVESVFPSVSSVLVHMYQVDYVWLKALKGEKFDDIIASVRQITEELAAANLSEMKSKFEDMGRQYETFIQNQSDLHAQTTIHHPYFGTLETSYADLIGHITNHGTYHRGHISAILNQLGNKGASTDYIFYLYALQNQ